MTLEGIAVGSRRDFSDSLQLTSLPGYTQPSTKSFRSRKRVRPTGTSSTGTT